MDFNLNKGSHMKTNEIDLILQQIDLLFDTSPGDLFGDENFGTQYDKYLYQLNLSAEELQSNIMADLKTINLYSFVPKVDVYLLQGTEQDIAIIDIQLTRNMETYRKIYKIQ